MSEMVDRVVEAIIAINERLSWPEADEIARAAIEATRELPEEPGPRYTAGEYSRRTQKAMVDDALDKVDA